MKRSFETSDEKETGEMTLMTISTEIARMWLRQLTMEIVMSGREIQLESAQEIVPEASEIDRDVVEVSVH
jgi:hypothetical protein